MQIAPPYATSQKSFVGSRQSHSTARHSSDLVLFLLPLTLSPSPSRITPAIDLSSWLIKPPPLSWTSKTSRIQLLTSTNKKCSGTGYSKLGFAGNDSPSFVFPTAIATKGPQGGSGGSGSGRPAVANKPTFLTGGAGPTGHLSGKRGTEDLDFFIGDEALAAAAGPGMTSFLACQAGIEYCG